MDNTKRYDRQLLIENWNQDKLTKGIVSIVGSDLLAQYTALPLAALGVGNIRIIDTETANKSESLLNIPLKGLKAESLECALNKINPQVNIVSLESNLNARAAQYFLEGSDIIIDATNNPVSKTHCLDYHLRTGVPLISMSADNYSGKVFIPSGRKDAMSLMPMYAGAVQGDLISLVLGGVTAEEVKKSLMNQDLMSNVYNYNLHSAERFSFKNDLDITAGDNFRDKKVLMVGAGALGCFLGPATINNIAPKSFDIIDYDTVEEHNLNRQVCFYDSVGKSKAEALADVLKSMSDGRTEIRSFSEKFTEDYILKENYDIIFDAVDSFYTKAMLHNYAKNNMIPIISGGTDYRAATVLVYAPTMTSCFDCQVNMTELAIKTEIIRRTSCLQSPNPSVIMTNQIAGGLMVGEAMRVLRPDVYGLPINAEIKYISDFDTRGGVTAHNFICDCHTRGARSLALPDVGDVKVVEKEVNNKIIKEVYVRGEKI